MSQRPRMTTPERKERIKESRRRYASKHADAIRRRIKLLGSRPEYLARRRELYALKQQASAEAGAQRRTRGRPRLDMTPEQLLEHRRYLGRERQRRLRSKVKEAKKAAE